MARTRLAVLLLAPFVAGLAVSTLLPDEVPVRRAAVAAPVVLAPPASVTSTIAVPAPTGSPTPLPRPIRKPRGTSRPDVEAILEAFDEDRPLDAAALAVVRATVEDAAAEVPLRYGCLRALLATEGSAALPGLCDLYGRDDAGALRSMIAFSVSRGAGPEDAALLLRLVDGAARTDDRGRYYALEAVVDAATRDEPVRVGPDLVVRLREGLHELARGAADEKVRVDAICALGSVAERDPRARDQLEALAASAPSEEDRLDAAFALRRADGERGARALAAVGPTLREPELRARWEAQDE